MFGAVTPLDAVEPRRGAAVMLEVLRSEGCRYIFGNPGTTELPLLDALTGMPDLSYILGLQEAAVVAMADGYAQASGRPGVVNLHTAGGLGHAMGALLNAHVAGTPLVVTAGQQDLRHNLTDPLLSGDLVRIAAPAVKWAHEIIDPDQIPVLVRRAFHDCTAAPSGPVFLSLPMNVMDRPTSVGPTELSVINRASIAGALDDLAESLAVVAPGKLAIIAGDEISTSDAAGETVRLAESLGSLVYGSSWPAHLPFPTAHPQWRGTLPTVAAEIRAILEPYDAIFALGGKSTVTILYSEGPAVPPRAKVYQLSSDVRDLGRTYATTLSCVGDIKASLRALQPKLDARLEGRGDAIAALRAQAADDRRSLRAALEGRYAAEWAAPVTTPFVAAAEIVRGVGTTVPIIDEAPATMPHVRAWLDSPAARQYSLNRGAALGWGMAAAVGASLGFDRAPVVSLVGDGSAMYTPQALWTAAHEGLPVTFVVVNNREYAILKNFMRGQAHYLSSRSNRFVGMDITEPAIDFLALAASMGVPAHRVARTADIAGAVEAGIASGRPNLIEIPIAVA